MVPVCPSILGERRGVAGLQGHARSRVAHISRRLNVWLVQINGVVHNGDDCQDVAVPRDVIGHGIHVGGLRATALEVTIFEMGSRDLQGVSNPLSGREARPAVGCIGWRMRPPVHVNRPVQRPHKLNVIRSDVARQGVLFLEDARPSEAAPLVGGRVRSALIFRCSPDRLRTGLGP